MTTIRTWPPLQESTGQWPRLLALGVLDTVIGVLAIAWPGVTVVALALLVGITLLLSGAVSIGFGMRLRRSGMSSGVVPTVLGIVSIIAAVICLIRPGTGVAAIAFAAALWFLLHGLADLGRAGADREHRLWWAAMGVLGIVAAVVLLVDLGAAVLTIALIVGISFLMRAAGEFVLALQLRRLHRSLPGG
jgi:uncharacterized membrane protein HdeD (DUF308 family)